VAEQRFALTSRNSLLPVRRWLAERWPDLMKSQGGGCNAILVRGDGIVSHDQLELRHRPERRVAHRVRLASGLTVVNLHATAHVPARAEQDVAKAAAHWGDADPLVFGGDLNLRDPHFGGMSHVAGRDVDHLFVRGLTPEGRTETLEHGPLSDHPPLVVSLR
jgi:endonuclease/exonuclease/phosphatase (EEP) superfamily protein YafD